ncbi:30S ribosomal protein S17 [Candidatus Uhrbacteria bacterium]|nr:30S ribosomal protein S17 [Candidatus Uhrbacteria bacterium]
MSTTTPVPHHRQLEGTVVSDKMQKTRVVLVERWKRHPKYGKSYRVHRRYKVHDPAESSHVGDRVRFEECRPISREKRWRLIAKQQSSRTVEQQSNEV